MQWIEWFKGLEWYRQAIFLGWPLVFCAAAPAALRWRGPKGLAMLWLGVIAPIVPFGWYEWRAHLSNESPFLPLFDIAVYALPVGIAAASAAVAVLHSAHRGRSSGAQFAAALLAAFVPLPLVLPATQLASLVIYGFTGGFI